ncbi:MAG: zf-HC2 domain-containing protein [Chitinispirillaceae bacterium]|nr:zf-HC2 domain-containing protein [Chitinispirillaceae bacterium]
MAESGCSRLAVERLAAGELTDSDAEKIETHLRSCSSCAAYRTRLEQTRQEFLRIHPFTELKAVGATRKSGELWYERLLGAITVPVLRPVLIPVCIALLAGIMILPFTGRRGLIDTDYRQDIRYKGTSQPLSYIYKRGDQVRESSLHDTLRAGDKVQIFYDSRKDQFLTLFSVTDRGGVSFYHPDARSLLCSIRTGVGKRLAYPVSIELDSTEGNELLVGLFSEKPFDTAGIKQWIAGLVEPGKATALLEQTIQRRLPHRQSSVATLMLRKE